MSIFFNKDKSQIGFIGGGATTSEKAMTILDLFNIMDKDYLVEQHIYGTKVYSYDVIDMVDKFLKDAGCCVVSIAIPNIDDRYGACFFTYQWPNETIMRTLSFVYKY